MKLNMPTRYYSGDNNDIQLLKKKLLMAREDIIFQYSTSGNADDWKNISSLMDNSTTGQWLTNKTITDYKIQYIRMSYDKGLTWPLKLKVNAGFMMSNSFTLSESSANIVDNTDSNTNSIFPKVHTISMLKSQYDTCKGNPVSLSIETDDGVLSLVTCVRFYKYVTEAVTEADTEADTDAVTDAVTGYAADVLLSEELIQQYSGKTCYVNILKNEVATAFNLPVPIYSNMVNATPIVYDDTYGQVYYLNNTYNQLEITSQLDSVNGIDLKMAVPALLSGTISGNLIFQTTPSDDFSGTFSIELDNEFKWYHFPVNSGVGSIDGQLKINLSGDLLNNLSGNSVIIRNIRTQSI